MKNLSEALRDTLTSSEPTVSFLIGGKGSGKTESIYRAIEKMRSVNENIQTIVLTLDFNQHFGQRKGEGSDSFHQIIRVLSRQIAQQIPLRHLCTLLKENCPNFDVKLRGFVATRPLWAHQTKGSMLAEEIWRKVITSQSVAAESLSQISFYEDPSAEMDMYMKILKGTGGTVTMCLTNTEAAPETALNVSNRSGFLSPLMDTSFNVLIECNDSLSNIYSISSIEDANIIEVSDLPKEAIKGVFVPSLLSDEVHVDGLYALTGGRVGLLEKFFVPLTVLNEQQKLANMEQEQRYRSGKENRPSDESKELQLDPSIHTREVTIRDSPINGVLKDDTEMFESAIDRAFTQFPPLAILRNSMSDNEYRVFVVESVRCIIDQIQRKGSLPLPADLSPMDIAHPVILALLHENMLMVRWIPFPRIVEESHLKLFLLDAWCASQVENLSGPATVAYNLIAMKNRVHIRKQLEKLSR
jgi:hypothetical protein